jgi:hypothetical protein
MCNIPYLIFLIDVQFVRMICLVLLVPLVEDGWRM